MTNRIHVYNIDNIRNVIINMYPISHILNVTTTIRNVTNNVIFL